MGEPPLYLRTKAFSLTEMLLVVALLLILISLLSLSLRRAYEQASMARCTNNMKNIHLAASVYAEDFDGHYPLTGENNEGSYKGDIRVQGAYGRNGRGLGFLLFYFNYIQPQSFWCPEDDAETEFSWNSGQSNEFARRQFYEPIAGREETFNTHGWGHHPISGTIEEKWERQFRGYLDKLDEEGKLWDGNAFLCDSGFRQGQLNPQISYFRGRGRIRDWGKTYLRK